MLAYMAPSVDPMQSNTMQVTPKQCRGISTSTLLISEQLSSLNRAGVKPDAIPLRPSSKPNLLPLHTPLLHSQPDQPRRPASSDSQHERLRHRQIVRLQHSPQQRRRRNLDHMRRARHDDQVRIQPGRPGEQLARQRVGEDVLRDADGERATKRVEEDSQRVGGGHVLRRADDLRRDEGDLDAAARADAGEQLEADPAVRAVVNAQGVQHAGADGEDGGAGPEEGRVRPEGGDQCADDDGGERHADEIGDGADPGALGCGGFYGLKVEGQEIDVGVQGHGDEGFEAAS